jgi:hypothetical protein
LLSCRADTTVELFPNIGIDRIDTLVFFDTTVISGKLGIIAVTGRVFPTGKSYQFAREQSGSPARESSIFAARNTYWRR